MGSKCLKGLSVSVYCGYCQQSPKMAQGKNISQGFTSSLHSLDNELIVGQPKIDYFCFFCPKKSSIEKIHSSTISSNALYRNFSGCSMLVVLIPFLTYSTGATQLILSFGPGWHCPLVIGKPRAPWTLNYPSKSLVVSRLCTVHVNIQISKILF